ncbi:MAG: universal stress protein [Thermodesulfobacteriota bacterium]|nr:universal stress protein [Thermodesulfobacteriota bacterium]
MEKKIIVAIDGSTHSDNSLSYIIKLFAKEQESHFHLTSWITNAATIMPTIADSKNSLIPNEGQNKKEAVTRRYLNQALRQLQDAGIDSERIETSIELSGAAIADSIQHQAEKELADAIVIGRRGLNGISEMLMGSVSTTLFRNCHSTPLWIIDGEIEYKDFLVPVDGTVFSLLAVDHLAHILKNREDLRISLFHCTALLGKKSTCKPELFYENWDKEWCDTYLSGEDCLFNGPKQLLLEAGIPEVNIQILPEKTDLEEGHGIVREAKIQKCGTVVLGRREAKIAKGFFGGVSDRTIKQAQNMALWIVG